MGDLTPCHCCNISTAVEEKKKRGTLCKIENAGHHLKLHENPLAGHFFTQRCWLWCSFSAKGRTNVELREKFILPEGTTQVMASFRYRGRRSRPSSRGASPNRSTSSQSCPIPSNLAPGNTGKVSGSALPSPSRSLLQSTSSIITITDFHFVDLPQLISLELLVCFAVILVDLFPLICESMSLFLFSWFTIVPQTPQHITRNYDKPWLANSKPSSPLKSSDSFGSQGSSSEVESCTAPGFECFTLTTQLKLKTPAPFGLSWLNLCWENFSSHGSGGYLTWEKKVLLAWNFSWVQKILTAFMSVPNLYSNVSLSL